MKDSPTNGEARKAGFERWVSHLRSPLAAAKRFWSKVEVRGVDQCWLWKGGKSGGGYGRTYFRGNTKNASRVAYLLSYGDFDEALDVLHHCDNPPCCNPYHLFLGTASDNIQDSIAKGRWVNPPRQDGEANGGHILTEQDVIAIRAMHANGGVTQRSIARLFRVNYRTVNLIVLRVNWRHIK